MRKTNDWNSLVELLRKRAAWTPDKTLYTFLTDTGEKQVTYGELDRRARQIGGQLEIEGERGDRVIIYCTPGLDYISAFFGCLYAGMIAVPAYPPKFNRNYEKIIRLFTDSGAKIVLASETILSAARKFIEQDSFLKLINWIDVSKVPEEMAKHWREPQTQKENIAFLQYTSGSTADPKGVMVTHGNLLANLQVIYEKFGESENSRGVIWLPPYHDMGLIGGVLEPLYGGFPTVLMSPFAFMQNPFIWLDAISRYQATTSGGPNFAYELCIQRVTKEQRETLNLSSWKVAFNGAEPVRQSTINGFTEMFQSCGFRKEAFYTCYGLAEATLLVTGIDQKEVPAFCCIDEEAVKYHQVAENLTGQGKCLVSNGSVFEEEKLLIVDPLTLNPCLPDQIGEVWISSPCVAQGYWNQKELTVKTFQAYAGNDGPYLRTGDLGFIKNKELYITGRYKDLIIIRGRNYYPQDIEFIVEKSHESFEPGSGIAFSVEQGEQEKLVVIFELKKKFMKADLQEVWEAAQKKLMDHDDLSMDVMVCVRPMSLSKTSSGKVQRSLCRKQYLNQELQVIGEMSGETAGKWSKEEDAEAVFVGEKGIPDWGLLLDYLVGQARHCLQIDPGVLDIHQPLNQYGFDSLMAVKFIHRIEESLHIQLSLEQMLGGWSLAQLCEAAEQELLLLKDKPEPSHDIGNAVNRADQLPWKDKPKLFLTEEDVVQQYYPLSHNQKSLFFMNRMLKGSPVYHLAFSVCFLEEPDFSLLQESFQKLVKYNPSLRTTFTFEGSQPVQSIYPDMEVIFYREDVSDEPDDDYKDRVQKEIDTPFDVEKGPLFRIHIFKRTDGFHLLLVIHHLITDFWSLTLMVRELGQIYTQAGNHPVGEPEWVAVKRPYTQYVLRQQQEIAKQTQLKEYWQNQLAGELPVLNLHTDYQRPAVLSFQGASEFLELEEAAAIQIKEFCGQNGVTVYMLLLAVFNLLLYKYTAQKDILIGSLSSGRQSVDFAHTMGYFVNPIVMRADLEGDPSFIELLKRIQRTVLKAFSHQEYPFDLLVEDLKVPRGISRAPVFQAMFVYQSSPDEELRGLNAFALNEVATVIQTGSLSVRLEPLPCTTVQYDITLTGTELEKGIGLSIQYNTSLFAPETIKAMLHHFQVLLDRVLNGPESRLSQIQVMDKDERKQMLEAYSNGWREYPQEALHHLIEKQALITPEATALCFEDDVMTYAQMEQKANRLARYLIRQGLTVNDPVALCMERSMEMVVGLLGILKAGGYYIPLDPTHPKDRLAFIIEDATGNGKKTMVLTQQKLLHIFSGYEGVKICVDEDDALIKTEEDYLPSVPVKPEDLAYTIYTSGSTGKPKGVQISHQAVVNFIHSMGKEPGITAEDCLLSVTTISFDIAALEVFLPLSCGAQVVIAGETTVLDGKKCSKLLHDKKITIMQGTPSIWQLLLEAGWQGKKDLKILCGGEPFPPELAEKLLPITKEVWNMYGPTETTIWSTVYQVKEVKGAIPIGHPIDNTAIYILDEYGSPVPVGVSGELCIGGDGVARGYFDRDELTAERFRPDPFGRQANSRIYKTGDLARYLRNGDIEFLGRMDNQVKVRGYRIETGEVEAALNTHLEIDASLVIARPNKAGMNQLIAYLISQGGENTHVDGLHRFLKEKLPDYMIPSYFIFLKEFPRTPNGKLDRKQLPEPENTRPDMENSLILPESRMEKQIAAIWSEALGIKEIGIHDNFFELGGNSMLMVQIQSRLLQEFPADSDEHAHSHQHEIGIVELFQYPTVASFAGYLTSDLADGIR